ncbi:ATP-binding protein [Agriterribacter sp.]|uniref:ATP-binding protein n=1 Tax=Agriterribacter sp. TaxID=2821509 RepID=UPI002BFB99E0|nr:ATP-binding protein [Agriterribacter sp.]HRO45281.1 ATP-binding protein [Agriterribacter sp.]HRQ16884.1 ATP-binding protein [Agriterribacter sp.]
MSTDHTGRSSEENKRYRDLPVSPEFIYLDTLIKYRLAPYFPSDVQVEEPLLPDLSNWYAPLSDFISNNKLNREESVLLLIVLTPYLYSDLFDHAIESRLNDAGNFPKIGGVRGKNSRAFLPTGETALFLLAGDDMQRRLEVQQLFGAEHLFGRKKILWLEELAQGEPPLSGRIILSQDYADILMYGKPSPPHFSITFPARRIEEKRQWESLVISEELQRQIEEITGWLKYNNTLLQQWGMQDRLKKGYRALFHGPPGTGKTLTAGLLANEMKRDIYKIDLSMVVSKYIGETEKNLEMLFSRAEDKGWILFFDEADALFGKRTNVRDAHDKYANQEVSYLLQRIEDYDGLIILATNMKGNIDDAFLRRFNAILKFPFPDAGERAQIWERSFPENIVFVAEPESIPGNGAGRVEWENAGLFNIVKKYELSGGSIINVVHYACLKSVERASAQVNISDRTNDAAGATGFSETIANPDKNFHHPPLVINLADVLHGIKRELSKEGKPFVR